MAFTAYKIISEHIKHLFRGSLICTIVYFIVYPWYNSIYDKLNSYSFMSDAYIFAMGVVFIHITVYWTINTFFYCCDTYKLFQKYKIPRLKSQQVSDELFSSTIKKALISQLIVEPLGSIYVLWPMFNYHGSQMRLEEQPSFLKVFMLILLSQELMEWLFYWIHRAVHIPFLYGPIHKQHHEYKGSISFAAEYANPVEGLLANFYPSLAGCLYTGAHPLIFFVYLLWRLYDTYEGHSGYSFCGTFLYNYFGLTFGDTALFHDFHHTKNNGNYGTHFQDWVFGTDTGYPKWLEKWEKSLKKQN